MRKQIAVLLPLTFLVLAMHGQDAVKWHFSARKIGDKTYEVTFKAVVSSPWHIYSQYSPEEGATPTKFTFSKNPLLTVSGKTKEIGDIKEKYEDVFDVTVKYFQGNVEFVQVVKLKTNVRTNLSGTIEFMACNEEQCLPAGSIPFKIDLN